MSLFKFDECEVCKQKCNDAKLLLHNSLPANVCEKISEYNIYCRQCNETMQREQEFMERYDDIDPNDYLKFHLQLKYFIKYNKEVKPFNWQLSKTAYKEQMKKLFSNEQLIERFGGGLKNVKKYRAFAIKHRELFIWIDHHIFDVERVKYEIKNYGVVKGSYSKYYGKKHSVVLLICLILWEMIYLKIGRENIKYINEDDIMKYVDLIMEEYLTKD